MSYLTDAELLAAMQKLHTRTPYTYQGVSQGFKVMAVIDGWVMWRHKGAMPALRHINQWHDGFEPAPDLKPKLRAAMAAEGKGKG